MNAWKTIKDLEKYESDVTYDKYGDPYSEFVLCIDPSKVHTHSSEHTHTVNTPGAVGSHLCCGAPEQLGVRCLAQGHLSRGIEGGESAVHSLPPPTILSARDSNLQPFDYESNSLTIMPQLPWDLGIF